MRQRLTERIRLVPKGCGCEVSQGSREGSKIWKEVLENLDRVYSGHFRWNGLSTLHLLTEEWLSVGLL